MEEIQKNLKETLLLGNEAVVRGALEAGLSFATTYPGTPTSEIGDILAKISPEAGIYFEYSTNEKVALEAAAGAGFSGLPSLVSMKHYGLNVALDSLLPLVYLEAPFVVVIGDDPGCFSSIQTEQDSRWFSFLGSIPFLEPADAQEAKDMTKYAFLLAKKYKIPVLLRLTTRICHTRSLVKFSKTIPAQKKGKFIKFFYEATSQATVNRHKILIKKIEKIKKESEKTSFNHVFKAKSSLGIITSGVSFYYIQEALKELGIKANILKIGMSFPFPEKMVSKFIKNLEQIFVAEEIDPILEKEIERIAKKINPSLKIYGKNLLPSFGEMKPEYVLIALSKILKKDLPQDLVVQKKFFKNLKIEKRFPTLCSGCPHRATFFAIKKIIRGKTIFGGDIGCYLLGSLQPFKLANFIVSMGAGIGVSHGISKSTGEKPVIFIGDSTFFHAGIPALINLVWHQANVLLVILDNSITAMTGHQPNPGEIIKIEEIIKACGVKILETTNVYNFNQTLEKIKKIYQEKGVCVLIAKGECRLLKIRKMAREGVSWPKFEIFEQNQRLEELKNFSCPAIRKKEGKYYIEENLCWGCSVCQQIFPKNIRIKNEKR